MQAAPTHASRWRSTRPPSRMSTARCCRGRGRSSTSPAARASVDVRMTGLPAYDADGRNAGATVVVRDVTEARQAARALRWQAQHDSLTRLPNHTALVERLDAALVAAAAGELPPAVLLLDLD